jgi:hypothetical protein
MKSDITRDTFRQTKHFSRVISQQGRVYVDADWNEQTSILLHYLRTLAMDLIGPYAAPVVGGGFTLKADADGLKIGAGRYYVDGILVENETECLYTQQPYSALPADDAFAKNITAKADASYWVYLDVWERHVTSLEDDSIREAALGGPDTCSRAQVAWQVRALDVNRQTQNTKAEQRLKWLTQKKTALEQRSKAATPALKAKIDKQLTKVNDQIDLIRKALGRFPGEAAPRKEDCAKPLYQLLPISDALMGARLNPGLQIVDACITSPDSKYRGAENQLYRVEIHRGGVAGEATFKWSRENASVATEWIGTTEYDLRVANARGFSAGNWIELMDDVTELQGRTGTLGRLTKVQGGSLTVDKDKVANADSLKWSKEAKNPRVRRWDHFETEDTVLQPDGSILIVETPIGTPDDAANWLDLEDGIQIQFAEGGEYRTGDYWLIPARVATGNIEWPPADDGMTRQSPPRGVLHHYAPLAFAIWAGGNVTFRGCDCTFGPLSSCFRPNLVSPTGDVAPTKPKEIVNSETVPSKRRAVRSRKEK